GGQARVQRESDEREYHAEHQQPRRADGEGGGHGQGGEEREQAAGRPQRPAASAVDRRADDSPDGEDRDQESGRRRRVVLDREGRYAHLDGADDRAHQTGGGQESAHARSAQQER